MSFIIRNNCQIFLDGRHIGWITKTMNGKKVYVSPRNRLGITKQGIGHRFEMFAGYGLAVSVFEFLKRNGFDEIHLKIGDETLIASLDVWEQHARPYRRQPYEPQIILPERFMEKKMLTLSEVTR